MAPSMSEAVALVTSLMSLDLGDITPREAENCTVLVTEGQDLTILASALATLGHLALEIPVWEEGEPRRRSALEETALYEGRRERFSEVPEYRGVFLDALGLLQVRRRSIQGLVTTEDYVIELTTFMATHGAAGIIPLAVTVHHLFTLAAGEDSRQALSVLHSMALDMASGDEA